MNIAFRIVPERNLVVVSYAGIVTAAETLSVLDDFEAHPDFRYGLNHLFDLTKVTKHARDFGMFFKLQARLTEIFGPTDGHDTLIAFVVASAAGREMAELSARSWSQVRHLVLVSFETEAEALAFLGQPETRIADLPPAPEVSYPR